MKRILLILLATILILLPSCTTIPDEPLSPVDSGNEGQEQPSDSDLSSDPRMTETQRQEIIDIIEKSSLKYDGSTLDGNVEVECFYHEPTLDRHGEYYTSFMDSGYGDIEKYPSAFEIFDETFFFPEAIGDYIYLFFRYSCSGTSMIENCVSVNFESGMLTLTIKRAWEVHDAVSYPLAIFKIKKSSLDGDIRQVKYAIDYSETQGY